MSSAAIRRIAVGAITGGAAYLVFSETRHRARILGPAAGQHTGGAVAQKRGQPNAAFAALGPPSDPALRAGILATVGNTPLVEIKSLSKATGCRILVKMEDRNPGGSVKDRAALYMVEDLERRGVIKADGTGVTTITEGTGGNTGIGLALVAAAKGLKLKLAMPKTIAQEKIQLMRAMGAEVLLCNPVPFTSMDHYYHTAKRLAAEHPDTHFFANQFENLWNGAAHYYSTGPEIWEQTDGKVDGFICSAGTGGTINGVSNALKERNPAVKTFLVDPYGSGLFCKVVDGDDKPRKTVQLADGSSFVHLPVTPGGSVSEGIGINRLTGNFANARIDGAVHCNDEELMEMAFFVQHHDGIFVGPSAALNIVGAVKLARKLGPGHVVVTIVCDSGTRYMSKMYTPEWVKNRGLEQPSRTHDTTLSWVGE